MSEHYVTLLDSGFLPWLICLKHSLDRYAGDYVLWVVAMDSALPRHLERLGMTSVRCIGIEQIEADFPRLSEIKSSRSRAEYCWTVTPFTFCAVWNQTPDVRVTYIDADVALLSSPQRLFAGFELSHADVQITDHGHDPAWAEDRISACGRYCVQFLTVRPTSAGREVLVWWQDRCLEWCYNRNEPGRYGDQKYLDDWPERFGSAVHVLDDPRLTQAPWNRDYSSAIMPCLYHYQGFRMVGRAKVMLWYGFRISSENVEGVYAPYLRDFATALRAVAQADITIPQSRYHFLKRLKAQWWHAPRGCSRIVSLPGSA